MARRAFPQEILIEILSRLPVKSLLCYRSVSKSWNFLIQDSGLVKLHQNHSQSTKENASLFVIRSIRLSLSPIGNSWFKTVCTPFVADSLTPIMDIDYYELPSVTYPKVTTYSTMELYGPCNGIICIKDHELGKNDYFVLCNPATREFKSLPDPLFSYPEDILARYTLVGFGFDVIANDYKLVRVVRPSCCDDYTHFHNNIRKVVMYSLRDDTWTEVDVDLPFSLYFVAHSSITFSDSCHWIGYDETLDEEDERYGEMYILVFDMVEEAFRKIQLTDQEDLSKGLDNFGRIMLIVINDGSLAIIKYELYITECYFHLWVMREYGVVESWQRILIGPLDGVYRPLASRNADEFFLENGDGDLISYNPATEAISAIGLSGIKYTFAVIIYQECLTSIKACSAKQ